MTTTTRSNQTTPITPFVVAIPTYNRVQEVVSKTLATLAKHHVNPNCIFLFVANGTQEAMYASAVPRHLYNTIVVGKKGIRNQRVFISSYFPPGQCVVSMDDDVEALQRLRGDTLVDIADLHAFFVSAFTRLRKEQLYLWGIYPVHNPFFMQPTVTTDLRFVIGVVFGFINRHDRTLYPSPKSESKEDYEQTLLFYHKDGGVVRFNNVTAKTKFNAPGGLGTDRYERNKRAADYLHRMYPDFITPFQRKTNGMPEVKLIRHPRINTAK